MNGRIVLWRIAAVSETDCSMMMNVTKNGLISILPMVRKRIQLAKLSSQWSFQICVDIASVASKGAGRGQEGMEHEEWMKQEESEVKERKDLKKEELDEAKRTISALQEENDIYSYLTYKAPYHASLYS